MALSVETRVSYVINVEADSFEVPQQLVQMHDDRPWLQFRPTNHKLITLVLRGTGQRMEKNASLSHCQGLKQLIEERNRASGLLSDRRHSLFEEAQAMNAENKSDLKRRKKTQTTPQNIGDVVKVGEITLRAAKKKSDALALPLYDGGVSLALVIDKIKQEIITLTPLRSYQKTGKFSSKKSEVDEDDNEEENS
eukprot:TRINITY_DN109321_c0_g1_i1.p1 TRINITY_DN109321_c0_g1~~TRINITY_DN109321_c0_g1_i1.p1  ORF type:complete len:194 (-),score=29.56 TRINITY_DN109321_c0_g1_i1:385-966(-)